jgi:hypothetical protein
MKCISMADSTAVAVPILLQVLAITTAYVTTMCAYIRTYLGVHATIAIAPVATSLTPIVLLPKASLRLLQRQRIAAPAAAAAPCCC